MIFHDISNSIKNKRHKLINEKAKSLHQFGPFVNNHKSFQKTAIIDLKGEYLKKEIKPSLRTHWGKCPRQLPISKPDMKVDMQILSYV